jgi:hypothetical protein
MKMIVVIFLIVFLGTSLEAQEPQTSRTLFQFGTLLTKGDDTGWDQMGVGFTFHNYCFFDPASPDGWYYGIMGSALSRSAGGIVLADTRLVTLGWRGNPLAWFGKPAFGLQFDAGLAPTIGSRIQGSTILGSTYTGVGVTLGLGFTILEGQDLGISWEPVFPITSWEGNSQAPNRGYSDFVVSWTVKSFVEFRSLPWSSHK